MRFELAVAVEQLLLQLVALAQSLAEEWRRHAPHRFIQGIDEEQAELGEQPLEQSLKGRAEGGAGLVRFSDHSRYLVAVRKWRKDFAQRIDRRRRNRDSAHRMLGSIHSVHAERDRPMIGAKYEAVVHFGEIVVLGSQPEHRHCRNALLGELRRQPGGRQRLVNRIGGAGEQTYLLARDHRDGSGPGQ